MGLYLSGFFTNLQYQIKIGQCTNTATIAIQGCSNKAYSTDVRWRMVYQYVLGQFKLWQLKDSQNQIKRMGGGGGFF